MPFGVNILLHTRMEKNCTFGFAGCVVFGLIMGRMKPNRRIGFMKFIGWCAVIISFGYVVVTKTGAFEYITNYFGIDTMGRNDVYKLH